MTDRVMISIFEPVHCTFQDWPWPACNFMLEFMDQQGKWTAGPIIAFADSECRCRLIQHFAAIAAAAIGSHQSVLNRFCAGPVSLTQQKLWTSDTSMNVMRMNMLQKVQNGLPQNLDCVYRGFQGNQVAPCQFQTILKLFLLLAGLCVA